MKKIISMLTISALALGSIFADVSLELTHKGYIASDEGKLIYDGYDDTLGCVVFEVSNDNAGVVVDFDPYIDDRDGTTQYADSKKNPTFKKGVKLDQYFGWVKFAEGAFKLQSGVWTERKVNRMKQDAAKWGNNEYEKYKLGVQKKGNNINAKTTAGLATDITNLTYVSSDDKTPLSTALTFNAENVFVTAAIVTNEFGTLDMKSGLAFEGGLSINEHNKVNAIFKTPKNNDLAIGLFWENTGLKEGLDLLAGVSIGREASKVHEFGIDIRARYEINETLALTTMNNLSYYGSTKTYDIWNMLSLAVKTSDTIKVTLTGEWTYVDLFHKTAGHTADSNDLGELDIIPGVTYSPAKGVDLSTGLILKTKGWARSATTEYAIPLVLHVAL